MRIVNFIIYLSIMSFQFLYAADILQCRDLFTDAYFNSAKINLPFKDPELESALLERRKIVNTINSNLKTSDFPLERVSLEADEKFRTIRLIHSINGRIPEGSKARILFLHGNGSSRSRAFSMAGILRTLVERLAPDSYRSGKTINYLRRNLNIPLAGEAIDLPGCGNGPALDDFPNIDKVADWLASYIIDMKKGSPELPIIVFTRSSSAALAIEVAKKYPKLIDAFILMSPTYPGDPQLIKDGTDVVKKMAEEGVFTINEPGLAWIDKILLQTKWTIDTFANIKAYILTGENDEQVVAKEKAFYKSFAQFNTSVTYHMFPGAEHNVLDTTDKQMEVTPGVYTNNKHLGQQAYLTVLEYINSVITGVNLN